MHSCEAFAGEVVERLVALDAEGHVRNEERIVPGFYLSWDEEEATVRHSYRAGQNNLVRLEAKISGKPRWQTLNVDLGAATFEEGEVIGLVADVESDQAADLELFIRSGIEDGHVDTPFADRLHIPAGRNVATVLHTVRPGDGIASSDGFHLLGIRLPKRDFRLELCSLRFFVLPAMHGLRSSAMTLSAEH